MFLTTHYSHYFEFLATLSFWFVVDNDTAKTSLRTKIGGIESMFSMPPIFLMYPYP